MKNLYLVVFRYATRDGVVTSKMAIQANDMSEALREFLALPADKDEAESWAETLKSIRSVAIEYFCRI